MVDVTAVKGHISQLVTGGITLPSWSSVASWYLRSLTARPLLAQKTGNRPCLCWRRVFVTWAAGTILLGTCWQVEAGWSNCMGVTITREYTQQWGYVQHWGYKQHWGYTLSSCCMNIPWQKWTETTYCNLTCWWVISETSFIFSGGCIGLCQT